MRKMLAIMLIGILTGSVMVNAAPAKGFVKPKDRDKCPVCGMFVAKYPDWVAEIVFQDGTYAVFDGVKDLMKFYFGLQSGGSGRQLNDIASMIVTDYYGVRQIDGYQAFYVLGSDTYGPMGKELIPFEQENDAREFLKDHRGTRVLRFKDVTRDVMKELE
jgi:nitrous oxide reductase accessory protein NosL